MLKKKSNVVAILSMSVLLTACFGGGGGGGNSGFSPDAFISAQFIDAPVKGLVIVRDDNAGGAGVTGDNGSFRCVPESTVTFKLAGLELGSAACGSKIYVDELGPDWPKAAQLLQSLSSTSQASGELDLSAFTSSNVLASLDLSNAGDVATAAAAHADIGFVSLATAQSAALDYKADATGLLGHKLAGRVFKSDDSSNDYIIISDFGFYGANLWIGGLVFMADGTTPSGCEEVGTFNTNGSMTIGLADASFQDECEAASQDNHSEAYSVFNTNFSIIDTGSTEAAADLRLVIDGISYCQVTDENDNSCNN